MSRLPVVRRFLGNSEQVASNAPPPRESTAQDLKFSPTFVPDFRLSIHRLRRGQGLIGIIFGWGSLIIFLALGSFPVTIQLGSALITVAALELIKIFSLTKWEVWPEVLNYSFFALYLIQLIIAESSNPTYNVIEVWSGVITQAGVAICLLIAIVAFKTPFVRSYFIEGMWMGSAPFAPPSKEAVLGDVNAMPSDSGQERLIYTHMTRYGTDAYKTARNMTFMWIGVFLIMGISAAIVAGIYGENFSSIPTWFVAVFVYVIPYGALVCGFVLQALWTKRYKAEVGARMRQLHMDQDKESQNY